MVAVREGEGASVELVERTYESGRYVTAYLAAQQLRLFAIDRDTPPERAVLAGRLLRATGAPRRARKVILETWRRHRDDPTASVFAFYELAATNPLSALDWMDRSGELVDATDELHADRLIARAMCLSELRDFLGAERAWEAARARHLRAWTWCARAMIDDARDRPEAALAAIEEARSLSPWYRPAVELAARILIRTRRAAEARELLTSAVGHLEAASTHLALALLHREADDLDGAIAALMRAVALAPAMERGVHDQIALQLGYLHYLRGDIAHAVFLMRLVEDERSNELADRIESTPGTRRRLAVPHVPQHHNTCAPATLTAIAGLWGAEVDHAELAEEICHDGTPAGNERKWADEQGFVTRQLTVTWNAARALIDAGIPIALTTSFSLGAHLQPVTGYDERRRSLLVMEPTAAGIVELDWDLLAESQAPFGPRGLVFVPATRAAVLDSLDLPDAPLYDHHYAIEMALQRNDRNGAQAAYDALVAAAPEGHYLRHHARRALASYDGDERGTLAWVAGLRAQHTEDLFLRICELSSLQGHASDERRGEIAQGLLAEHRDDAAAMVACGRFLLATGEVARATALAHHAIAIAPAHAAGYHLAADLEWITGDRPRATQLLRMASCLAEGNEAVAWSYFVTALITGSVADALEHLRERVERMRARSGGPAQTLCDAYRSVGRPAEGLALLDDALALHPEDGFVALVAAEQHRISGDLDRAAALLGEARGKAPDRPWRRASAALALQRGETSEALALLRGLVEDDPLDVASQQTYVELLERTGAAEAARAHIVAISERLPYHIPLAQLCHQVIRARDPAAARSHLERLVERQPRSAWALYRLVDWHLQRGELAAARGFLGRAGECTDDLAAHKVVAAVLDAREGRRDTAMALLRAALAIDVDAHGAVSQLLGLARDGGEARAMLDEVAAELTRQGSAGPGIMAYSAGLRDWLDPLGALARLRSLRVARPHQWHAWSAETDALLGAGRLDEAVALATAATERYGHDPRVWGQLAEVERERGNRPGQIAALERAVELDPRAADHRRRLADAFVAIDDLARARESLDRALAEEPLGESNFGLLARIEHLAGDDDAACRHLDRALELTAEYEWAWHRLLEWSPDERTVFAAARAAIEREPTVIAPRLLLADFAPDLSIDERVALLDETIRIAPDRTELYDAKATLLANHERWEEARATCQPAFWGESPPSTLRGRAAWIRYTRGEREEAITDLLAVIAATPSYGWGIEHLLSWGKAVGAPVGTAERLVEIAPESALAHAVLGEARRESGDHEDAEASFARALEIDGTHQLARLGLFDVRYEQAKYESAAPLLDALPDDHPYVMARHVQILAVTDRLDEADAALTRMLRRGIEDPERIEEALVGYRRARAQERVELLLDRLLAEPDAPRAVAAAWWNHVGRHRGFFRRWRQIVRLPASQASTLATACHVEDYGDRQDFLGLLVFLLLNYRVARARTDVWGSVGYCLARVGRLLWTRWWMRDYARRDGVKPSMLNVLARVLILGGHVDRALKVCRRALELPADHTTPSVRLLVAPLEALSDEDAAARTVSSARRGGWSEDDHFLAGLADAVITYRRSVREAADRDVLAHACQQLWRRHRAQVTSVCGQVYEHVITQLARSLPKRRWEWLLEMRNARLRA